MILFNNQILIGELNENYHMLILTVLTFSPLLFVGEETPNEGLTAIIKLYETKDFDTLVRERYAELHKAKSEAKL